ncbi:MAG: hypothetical protein HPM95_00715 [Alphaproteobacteria bacterium]|nr:hypothetical protein [Alphaproteobacteria bacterium]
MVPGESARRRFGRCSDGAGLGRCDRAINWGYAYDEAKPGKGESQDCSSPAARRPGRGARTIPSEKSVVAVPVLGGPMLSGKPDLSA